MTLAAVKRYVQLKCTYILSTTIVNNIGEIGNYKYIFK